MYNIMKTFIKKLLLKKWDNLENVIHNHIFKKTLYLKPKISLSPIHSIYRTTIRKN